MVLVPFSFGYICMKIVVWNFNIRLVWSSVAWLLSYDVAINFVIKLVINNLLVGY
jgi:hypothetical protein